MGRPALTQTHTHKEAVTNSAAAVTALALFSLTALAWQSHALIHARVRKLRQRHTTATTIAGTVASVN